jgi:DNA (cytosine-5)-methyltransferase 1
MVNEVPAPPPAPWLRQHGATVHELTCLEICAGAGGQSIGLEQAGFTHAAAVELDPDGHPWEVAHNPGWELRADGSVRLTE